MKNRHSIKSETENSVSSVEPKDCSTSRNIHLVPREEKKPRTADETFRAKKFRIHPDVVINEDDTNNGQTDARTNPNSKRKKGFTIAKKVYVDQNGVIIKDSYTPMKDQNSKQIETPEFNNIKSKSIGAKFTANNKSQRKIQFQFDQDQVSKNQTVKIGNRIQIPGMPQDQYMFGMGMGMGSMRRMIGKENKQQPQKNENLVLTNHMKNTMKVEEEVDKHLQQQKSPYDNQFSEFGRFEDEGSPELKRENSGRIHKRCLLGDNDAYNEGKKIRDRNIKEERRKQRELEFAQNNGSKLSKKASKSFSSKSVTKRMSTTYLLGNTSSQGSQYGLNKMSFGQKAKKKVNNLNVKDMTENDYENLCIEVTRRLINNKEEEHKYYSKLFCHTTKNINQTGTTSQFSFAGAKASNNNHQRNNTKVSGFSDLRVNTQPDTHTGILKTRNYDIDSFLTPTTHLTERAKLNTQQHQRHRIESICSPSMKKAYPLAMQLQETKDIRRLKNYEKYSHIWTNYEKQVEQHFQNQESIKHGKGLPALPDQELVKQQLQKQMKNHMDQKQLVIDFKKAGALSDDGAAHASQLSLSAVDSPNTNSNQVSQRLIQTTQDELQFGDTNFSQFNQTQTMKNAKRTSIINQAEVFTQRQVLREALKLAITDEKQYVNDQIWYDSLRETDDGRFSQTNVFGYHPDFQKDKVQKRNDYIKEKVLSSTFKRLSACLNPEKLEEAQIASHSKSMNKIQHRPFNSQSRMHYKPFQNNKSGNLFARKAVFPKKDRTGGFSGQELHQISQSPKYRTTQGSMSNMKTTDTFILTSRLYDKILDETQPKIEQCQEVFGKPNVLIKAKNNEQIMQELLIQNERDNTTPQIQKYLAKIHHDDEINEYNRAQITEHIAATYYQNRKSKFGEGANLKSDFKIIDKIDSQGNKHSYINQISSKNKTRLQKVMNGMSDVNEMCFLQVKGKNQFEKEILETKQIGQKVIDQSALHRNENTHEIEGMEDEENAHINTISSKSLESAIKEDCISQSDTRRKVSKSKSQSNIELVSSVDDSSAQKQKKESLQQQKKINYSKYKVEQLIAQHIEKQQLF